MSTSIDKKYVTETAHIVRDAISDRCKFNIHGHSYTWAVRITGPVQENGMVLDFKELAPIGEFIDQFDHACIFWSNEKDEIVNFFLKNFKRVIIMNENCTAENMARMLHRFTTEFLQIKKTNNYLINPYTVSVRVWETAKGSAIATDSSAEDFCTSYIRE